MNTQNHLPQHVAIIMDGNRRWARKNGLKAISGHRKVAEEVVERLVDRAVALGIPYMTFWAWSTENWNRDKSDVDGIMNLFRDTFDTSSKRLHEKGVKIRVIGDMSDFPQDIQENVDFWIRETQKNKKITVVFALNYGGRDEIIRGIQRLSRDERELEETTTESFSQYLDTKGIPDPDIIIRPGGEQRLSGFLAWQSVYSELYFTDVLMPDFNENEFDLALSEFARRKRRFGK